MSTIGAPRARVNNARAIVAFIPTRPHPMHASMKIKRTLLASALLASLQALAQQQPPAAKPTEVEAAPQQIESIVVQGQFLGAGAQSAMKLDIPVRDTPFAVSSYGESFMKAVETAAVADMYNYMTGVKRAGNQAYDITIRGFKTSNTDKNAIMVDGLPGLSGKFASPPTIGVERVELVKGPMSVLYGQIQPGGFVNMITKKPRATQAFEVDVRGQTYFGDKPSFGDRNGYAASADLTGPIDKDGKFLYR